jgi:hypothetical protein
MPVGYGEGEYGVGPYGGVPEPSYSIGIEFVAGSFTEVGSDCLRLTITRERGGGAFETLRKGDAVLLLDNEERRYSPENSESPFSPHLKPNKALRIQATHSGSTYNLFRGFLDSIRAEPGLHRRTATIKASDLVKKLEQQVLDLVLFTEINAGSLFVNILSASGLTAADWTIDTMQEQIPFAWYRDKPADQAVGELLRFGHYYAVVDPGGRLRVEDRFWATGATRVGSYINDFFGVTYELNESRIVNIAKVEGEPRKKSAIVQSIAWIEHSIPIPGSAAVGFTLDYTDPDTREGNVPATEMVTPVRSVDYLTNTSSDATGTDKTALASAQVTFLGASAVCSIFNGDPGQVYLHRFVLQGKPIPRQPRIRAETKDSSSQAVYGNRPFTLASDLIGRVDYAKAYADYIRQAWADPLAEPGIALKNVFPDVLARDVGDKIAVVESHTAIGGDYIITAVAHDISLGRGLQHRVSYGLEFFKDPLVLILDDPVNGQLDAGRRYAF